MALSDDVQARVPASVLITLTNPSGGTSPTSIDSTKLEQACTSVTAYFQRDAKQTYDSTVPIHVEVCINGVLGLLRLWSEGLYAATGEFWTAFRDECIRTTQRIVPTNNSELTPAQENPSGVELRPWSDDGLMRRIHIRRPG